MSNVVVWRINSRGDVAAAIRRLRHGAAFVVRNANGQGLSYVYYEDEPGRRSAAKLLTKDEARRIAANIAAAARIEGLRFWRAVMVLLLGAIVGLILWTPALPWLLKSVGFD